MTELNKLGHGGRLRFLAKDTAVYGIGGALTKLLSLITFPLLARHFSVQDFGIIDLLNTAVLLLSVLLAFGLDSAVARFFYENSETEYRRQIVSQALLIQVVILAFALPILWVNTDVIGSFIDAGPNSSIILHLLILQSPLFVLLGFAQSLLKWTFKRWLYMLISAGSVVMTVIGLVVGIVFFNFGVVEVFIVYLATRAIFAIIGLWCVRQWITIPAGWDRLKEMLPFAAPLGVICVMGALLPFMERSMVQSLLGAEDLGLYAAGAKVGMLISLPIGAFEIAWGPFSLSIFKEKDASESFRHVLRVFAVLVFAMVLALAALAGPVLRLLGSARYEGALSRCSP
jgi:O-antigen/teichoic acid export membrane protein